MAGLIDELKRRKVFRVLVAYVIAAWLLLQVAEVLSSILSLPDWAPKLVLFLLAIGLLPALILAWAYELTPDGIKRDADVKGTAPQAGSGRLRVVRGSFSASWRNGSDVDDSRRDLGFRVACDP